jgi:hypothetical protein
MVLNGHKTSVGNTIMFVYCTHSKYECLKAHMNINNIIQTNVERKDISDTVENATITWRISLKGRNFV